MLEIRTYRGTDAESVGVLIADTFAEFNLAGMTPENRVAMLGPFAFAHSPLPAHREAIADAIAAPSLWVAEEDGEIVGILRGGRTDNKGRTVLSSLFVDGQHQRRGVGRTLVERFEQEHVAQGVTVFKLAATLYAVPFYLDVGYRRSTGIRSTRSFGTPGLPYQPMKKTLENVNRGPHSRGS